MLNWHMLSTLFDLLNVCSHWVVRSQPIEQQLAVTNDYSEEIVEVMRDTACQTAHCFHSLRLEKVLFEASVLCHVIKDDQSCDDVTVSI